MQRTSNWPMRMLVDMTSQRRRPDRASPLWAELISYSCHGSGRFDRNTRCFLFFCSIGCVPWCTMNGNRRETAAMRPVRNFLRFFPNFFTCSTQLLCTNHFKFKRVDERIFAKIFWYYYNDFSVVVFVIACYLLVSWRVADHHFIV